MLFQIHINLNFREISVLLRSTDGERTIPSEMGFGAEGVREGLSALPCVCRRLSFKQVRNPSSKSKGAHIYL